MQVYSQDTLFAVARLEAAAPIPAWADGFFSVTRTVNELSIVCAAGAVPADVQAERGFRMLMVDGPLDFSLTGVLSSITGALAEAGVSVFTISTYDTDYVLIRDEKFSEAAGALRVAGWEIAE
ncbi:MAG TPA: ACT domain-containing protein [Bryobacteraceae bacterium]|jgi:hypothetical protein